jgi:hypothetical protein
MIAALIAGPQFQIGLVTGSLLATVIVGSVSILIEWLIGHHQHKLGKNWWKK